jgi:fused signal recognition particle receptor
MSWLKKLKDGLRKSSDKLVDGIGRALNLGRLDAESLEALEEALIEADLGPAVAAKLVDGIRARKFPAGTPAIEVRRALAADIAAILAPVAQTWSPDRANRPHVVLVVGVNAALKAEGKSVMLAAGDTFRAAAVRQLEIWGERTGVAVVSGKEGADPAALAYEALEKARAADIDVLLIDTAGRLHNKADLMEELKKVVRVVKKLEPSAPHDTMLVLDATIGQNALQQVETFKSIVAVDKLVVTKLDGSAKGGVLVAIANRCATPTVLIGVGEGIDDLKSFDAQNFSAGLLGLVDGEK